MLWNCFVRENYWMVPIFLCSFQLLSVITHHRLQLHTEHYWDSALLLLIASSLRFSEVSPSSWLSTRPSFLSRSFWCIQMAQNVWTDYTQKLKWMDAQKLILTLTFSRVCSLPLVGQSSIAQTLVNLAVQHEKWVRNLLWPRSILELSTISFG